MKSFFLGIGSNIDPKKNIPACLELLKKNFSVTKISSIYETEPVGPAGKAKFWNLAVRIETELDAKTLEMEVQRLEERLGRKRDPANKFAARTIDIDLLPQPGFEEQAFLMIPLAEIAPREKATDGRSFEEIATELGKIPGALQKVRKLLVPF